MIKSEYEVDEELKSFTLMLHNLGIIKNGMDAFCLWRALLKREYIMENS